MLATALQNPLFWAAVIGWILSVTLHEFAHGLVAHLGGDYTIRERGGLTLNPLQYVDPLNSLVLPVVIFLLGGLALPGGVTYVREDLLRSRLWNSAVSAAGPLMNLILFILCGLAIHPAVGWVDPDAPIQNWSNAQQFVGAMACLMMIAVVINLVPVPGFDGFGVIAPWLRADLREKLLAPHLRSIYFFGYFLLLWTPPARYAMGMSVYHAASLLGISPRHVLESYELVVRGFVG